MANRKLETLKQVYNAHVQAGQKVPEGILKQIQNEMLTEAVQSATPSTTSLTAAAAAAMKTQAVSSVNSGPKHPLQYLNEQLNAVRKRRLEAEQNLMLQEKVVQQGENQILNNLSSMEGAKGLASDLKRSLPPGLVPGNVGDINQVIWPFWFTGSAPVLEPNTTGKSIISITQEAAFIVMSYTKSIFKKTDIVPPPAPPAQSWYYEYIDPYQAGATGKIPNLNFSIVDAQSSRVFHNTGLDVNQAGNWFNPTKLINPTLFLPNSTIEINWTNSDASETYVPFITLLGYRMRISDAQDLLSTIVG